jgi:hypothetical protein
MKKLFILILPVLFITGCGDDSNSNPTKNEKLPMEVKRLDDSKSFGYYEEITFKKHEYLVAKYNAVSMIHSESCPCKNK